MRHMILSAALMASVSMISVSAVAAEEAQAQTPAPAQHHAHWGYTGEGAAANWGSIDASYEVCKAGLMQSPINIDQFNKKDLAPLQFSYSVSETLNVVNNGHTIQANFEPGNSLTVGEKTYQLAQLHFHTPSEHYIDGAPYPMEMHLVHKAADGELAVVGVMMEVGGEGHNQNLETIWQNAPIVAGENTAEGVSFSPASLLPSESSYFKYVGSLTTPPCSEGVQWHVMQDPIQISAGQLTAFQRLFPINARMIQPLNGRMVTGF